MLGIGGAFTFAYVLHARVTPFPLLDLRLLSVPTFRASVIGGSLFRVGVGSLPFLLPLLFQIGFGLSPLQSGLLTFAGAVGAMAMRASVAPILRRFGIKRVLLINTGVASAFIAACALFKPDTPYWFILSVLLIGGFFRSLQFSSVNSLAFADLGDSDMSKATGFTSVAQQLSITAGIAIGALGLEVARHFRGDAMLVPADFSWAILLVSLISVSSFFVLLPLPIDAGASLTASPPPEAPPPESGKL
jgi:MFS family permease